TEHLKSVAADPNRSLYMTRVGMADVSEEAAEQVALVNQEFFRAIHAWLLPFVEAGEVIRVAPALYVPLLIGPAAHFARHWLANRMTLDLLEVSDSLAEAAWKALTPAK